MDWFKQQKRAAQQAQALLEKVDALIVRADALIGQLEELVSAAGMAPRREKDITDGLYGILSYPGRGEQDG